MARHQKNSVKITPTDEAIIERQREIAKKLQLRKVENMLNEVQCVDMTYEQRIFLGVMLRNTIEAHRAECPMNYCSTMKALKDLLSTVDPDFDKYGLEG
jgi:hypothetical protein